MSPDRRVESKQASRQAGGQAAGQAGEQVFEGALLPAGCHWLAKEQKFTCCFACSELTPLVGWWHWKWCCCDSSLAGKLILGAESGRV